MWSISWKYGLLCAVFLLGLFFLSIWLGGNPLVEIKHFVFDILVFFLFIYFANREFREYSNAGILHFWQGISIGFLVFLPAILVFSLSLFLLMESFPSILDLYKQGAAEFLNSNREFYEGEIGREALDALYAYIDTVTNIKLVSRSLGNKIFSAFLITPVVSILLRKKPR